jgi:FkbM family methyltransferase
MIIVADKVKSEFTEATTTIYKMFEIIFIKKYPIINYFFTDNLLYNLQFFIENCMKQSENFINLFQTYIDYLQDAGYDVYKHNFISSFEKYGLVLKKIKKSLFSNEECMKSNKILFYTGYANLPWNYTFSVSNALGGSETAVANLSRYFPKYYEIYVAGQVQEERVDNISYINLNTLQNIVKTTPFHTVIVSRYIAFYEIFQEASYYQSFIWGHDVHLINYGCGLDSNSILGKWKNKINGCICQTEWHKNLFSERYPEINDKLFIINNGILVDKFTCKPMKNANRFIYTSCSERGLDRVIELWPEITDLFPDAELYICSYNPFPSNEFERTTLQNNMKKYESIKHLGCLNKDELYKLMSTAEYWFYPTNWPETSCITAMEMLMSEVICVYYPIAGLVDTLGDFGIKVDKGNEIKVFEELTSKKKSEIKKKGKEYALSCSWENRSSLWMQSIFNSYNKDITYNIDIEKRIRNLYEGPCMIPKVHIDFLKKLRDEENFQPKVIYDIGANVLHWTREAKNIWQNSEIIVFDAIKTGEFLYKEQNLKYHIGVLSDEDNKTVKFYENLEHPAGNSYYQEIGHPKSSEIYPDNCFTVQNAMTLSSVVKMNKFSYPDLIKIDVQGAELDIMKGSLDVINKSKYLIVELQNTQYNKQAPLCDETISFLNENGWDLYAEKFSDNGPDADYCFVNRKYEKWVVFVDEYTVICLEDYINSLKTEYNIEFTKDKNYILNSNFDHISFLGIYLSNNKNRIDLYDKIRNNNIKISIINTEPLNIKCRIYELTTCYNELTAEFNKDITIYDYSLSNISILNGTNIYNTQHLNYIVYDNENKFLTNIYKNNTKRFDFGIVSYDNPISCERRQKVVNYLRNNGYTVNIITGWGNKRDEELSTCNVILNIHGFWIEPTAIFEHIRCDRLLSAGFKILSEESINLDINFINKYPNLKIIKYDNFFDLKTYL